MGNWLAIRTVGAFRRGHEYTSAQLGVVGRMAVKCGHIIPAENIPARIVTAPQRATRPRNARRGTQTKGAQDGQQGDVQAGSGESVRDGDGS